MKTSEENIKRLLEMLDNPSAYSEQEISDIINRDDETREAYRLMVAAKQGYRRKNTSEEADAEAAGDVGVQKGLKAKLKNFKQSLKGLSDAQKLILLTIAVVLPAGIVLALALASFLKKRKK